MPLYTTDDPETEMDLVDESDFISVADTLLAISKLFPTRALSLDWLDVGICRGTIPVAARYVIERRIRRQRAPGESPVEVWTYEAPKGELCRCAVLNLFDRMYTFRLWGQQGGDIKEEVPE